ncbi:UNVERIFIED_CONTAM: hypothetical protein RMT77_007030 [Armadillidium vulgare]
MYTAKKKFAFLLTFIVLANFLTCRGFLDEDIRVGPTGRIAKCMACGEKCRHLCGHPAFSACCKINNSG